MKRSASVSSSTGSLQGRFDSSEVTDALFVKPKDRERSQEGPYSFGLGLWMTRFGRPVIQFSCGNPRCRYVIKSVPATGKNADSGPEDFNTDIRIENSHRSTFRPVERAAYIRAASSAASSVPHLSPSVSQTVSWASISARS